MLCPRFPTSFLPCEMSFCCRVYVKWWQGCKSTCDARTMWGAEASVVLSTLLKKGGAAILFAANIWPNHSANSRRQDAWGHLQILRLVFRECQTVRVAKQICITARDRLVELILENVCR